MSSPSGLGDKAFEVTAVLPFTTSTARFFIRTSDTGTVGTTSTVVDLSRTIHVGVTGGKPLDSTVHRRNGGPSVWKSVMVSAPLELVYHSSGKNTFVTVAHKCRAATSGAGSTWRTLKTDVFRFKMGTDTDATFLKGFASSANLMATDKLYKCNITFAWKKTSDTSVKDTTTEQELICNGPVIHLYGDDVPTNVPFKVS